MFEFIFLVGLAIVALWILLDIHWRATTPLNERLATYRDPSDAKYLAEMPLGISDEVALGVRRILVDVGGVEADEVWPETSLVDLLE
jgi:hypothetical protein